MSVPATQSQADAKTASSSFARLAAELAAPREAIETGFLAAGRSLTDSAILLNGLTRQFEALPESLTSAEVEQASVSLSTLAVRARAIADDFAREKQDLLALVAAIAATSAPIEELRRSIKMMGIVSINARVTAAGIVGDGDDFEVFTTDIAHLSARANQAIQEFARDYQRVAAEVGMAAAQRDRFEREHAGSLTALAGRLESALGALSEQRLRAVAGAAETGRMARVIAGRVGGAVLALQVGDSTRQRLEHIEAALLELADDNIDGDVGGVIAALQQDQLADASASFETELAAAVAALDALIPEASGLVQHGRDTYGGSGGNTALSDLNAQISLALVTLRVFEQERSKLETVARVVRSTVRALLAHVEIVQDIEGNMRLVSLNAAVRCAQLGPRGASLTVIAMQLRDLTRETVASAKTATERLGEASGRVDAFEAAADGSMVAELAELDHRAGQALTLLSGIDAGLSGALSGLDAAGPRVLHAIRAAAAELNAQSALAETISDCHLALAELAADAIPAPADMPIGVIEIAQRLAGAYTMQAERDIHAALLGAVEAPVAEPAAAADDALFDFEL